MENRLYRNQYSTKQQWLQRLFGYKRNFIDTVEEIKAIPYEGN